MSTVMKIRIDVDGAHLTATLDDTVVARDFAALLPLTLTLHDYDHTEKISYLPKRLSAEGAPAGVEPSTGDLAYYAPWGNLAIFYKDFPYSRGLVKLGRLDSGIERLERSDAVHVTIRRDDDSRPVNDARIEKEQHMNRQETPWPPDELRRIAETDDLHISPFREDGVTYGTPTWIWSVVVDDGLYVRGYNGQQSRWFQAAIRERAGRIRAAGITKDVVFEPVDGPINERIDEAYRAKYAGSPYLKPMIAARARSATVRAVPRG